MLAAFDSHIISHHHRQFYIHTNLKMVELTPTKMDLNAFNVSYYPKDLLELWKWFLCAELVSHSPIKQHHDNDVFKDWVFIGKCGAYLRIEPKFKKQPEYLIWDHQRF